MGGIGLPELLIVLVIIMIIFGAGKIPGIGSAFGNTIRNFKRSMKESGEETGKEPGGDDASVEDISQLAKDGGDSITTVPETAESAGTKPQQNSIDSSPGTSGKI